MVGHQRCAGVGALLALFVLFAGCDSDPAPPDGDSGASTDLALDGDEPDAVPPGADLASDVLPDAAPNQPPVASAGAAQNVATGAQVSLDGSLSSDPDGDTLSFSWQLGSMPAGSTASLSDPASSHPSFTADVDGTYVVQLTVSDGQASSAQASVVITAATVDPVPVNPVTIKPLTHWHYRDGPTSGTMNTITYYEVTRDYTIDLLDYFDDLAKLPEKHFKWDKTEAQRQIIVSHMKGTFRNHIKWDFVELENSVLTIKKGYRWDGASTPWNTLNLADNRKFYIRPSVVHDALYDLMRMGYLLHDEGVLGVGSKYDFADPHFLNRFVADCMIYMLMVEDGRNDGVAVNMAQADFEVIRDGGAPKTHKDKLLSSWKYHVSELALWPKAGGGIDVHWTPADIAGKDPDGYLAKPHVYDVYRQVMPTGAWTKQFNVLYGPQTADATKVYYTDTAPPAGGPLGYFVRVAAGYLDDETFAAVINPTSGPGNALSLGGYYEYVEADTLPADFADSILPFEAHTVELWVLPEYHPDASAILALNDPSGAGNDHVLYYDGPQKTFCFKDKTSDVCSTTQFPTGTWHHLALTVDPAGKGKLWVDGKQEAAFQSQSKPSQTALLSIGQERSLTQAFNHFKGKIDELRIWTVARSEAQLKAGMCAPARGDETGLIGLWHFDEPLDSKQFHDATLQGHLATAHGFDPKLSPLAPSGALENAGQCAAP